LKQPITAAITDAKTCLRWLSRDHPDLDEAREAASRAIKDNTRAVEIIDRLRSLYKKEPPKRELVDVNDVARNMLAVLDSEASHYSIAMRADLVALSSRRTTAGCGSRETRVPARRSISGSRSGRVQPARLQPTELFPRSVSE